MRYREALGLLALLVLLAAAGCGTRRSVLSAEAGLDAAPSLVTEPLRKGDLIELELADGSRLVGKVRGFEPGTLLLLTAKSRGAAPSLFGRKETLRIPLAEIRAGVRLGRQQPMGMLAFLGALVLGLVLLGVS